MTHTAEQHTTSPVNISHTAPSDEQIAKHIYAKLARELGVKVSQINAFVKLYDDGATIPFIARYRKEATQGLDDAQLRALEKGLGYERDMAARRNKILDLLSQQGNLSEDLQARIEAATSKLELEDIYLPYRPRRRSLASKAAAAGLDVVADAILHSEITPQAALAGYQVPDKVVDDTGTEIEVDFSDFDKQLAGVEAIIIDGWTQALDLLDEVRQGFAKTATINAQLVSEDKREVGEKFKDYFEHSESLARLPNHRLLAMLRGRQENVLSLKVDGEDAPFIEKIISHFQVDALQPSERRQFLQAAATALWSQKWRGHIEHRLLTEKRLAAEADAIGVFANNLQHLLMAAPAGGKVILGVDPGIRHGVKMAVIDANGHVARSVSSQDSDTDTATATTADGIQLATATVYPFAPDNKMSEAKVVITQLLRDYQVELIAIGNGTASRETDAMIKSILADNDDLQATAVMVNESGASVYSASELASDELADLDVSLRGAVSIARRLQDPLSELVKVEPKAIGVGQYQHDVNQSQLSDSLDKVTQDCVNAVGVDVNTASPAILAHIAGLNRNVAEQIVNYRKQYGAFASREQLKNVPRLGVKTFEQAAGFLRIREGEQPLDATGVHPESYSLVNTLLAQSGKTLTEVLGNDELLNSLYASYVKAQTTDEAATDHTSLRSVIAELAKPAHDPRPEFKTASFRDDVNSIHDLEVGMSLEGVVTNVTAFGCFVDVGVHQDGLVHISEMADNFIADPINHVKPGDIVKVRVLSVDSDRQRIGFSMKPEAAANRQSKSNRHQNQGDARRQTVAKNSSSDQSRSQQRSKQSKHGTANQHTRKQGKGSKQGGKQGERDSGNSGNQPQSKLGTLGALLKEAGL